VLALCAISASGCSSEDKAATTSTATSVKIEVTAPGDGSAVRADRVTVRGTVTPGDATVQIVGRPAQVGNGVFTGSVALHAGSNAIDVVASSPGAAPAATTITVKRAVASKRKAKAIRVRGAPPLSGARDCGGGLTAGARTSCPFADNVRATYEQSGSGVLDVYSPTTGQTYRMYCTSSSPHVCTGGNGASVYFASNGVATSYDTSGCGGGLLVGPNTSCGFAANVRDSFYRQGAGWIAVRSPLTGRTYDMYCTESSPHVCTGGNNAAVYFP
jgi:hypothetical protein